MFTSDLKKTDTFFYDGEIVVVTRPAVPWTNVIYGLYCTGPKSNEGLPGDMEYGFTPEEIARFNEDITVDTAPFYYD